MRSKLKTRGMKIINTREHKFLFEFSPGLSFCRPSPSFDNNNLRLSIETSSQYYQLGLAGFISSPFDVTISQLVIVRFFFYFDFVKRSAVLHQKMLSTQHCQIVEGALVSGTGSQAVHESPRATLAPSHPHYTLVLIREADCSMLSCCRVEGT